MADSLHAKPQFDPSKNLVIYGRNAVYEALNDKSLSITKIHLADSNRQSTAIKNILAAAERRSISVEYKDKRALSFISRNAKQDQGVAADIYLTDLGFLEDMQLGDTLSPQAGVVTTNNQRLVLLDGVTNPQNVGMIIRSVAAAGNSTLVLPQKGCADLGPLVIKASAGAVFRCPILRCDTAAKAADWLQRQGVALCGLTANASRSLQDYSRSKDRANRPTAYVLGNETTGLSESISDKLDERLYIPMQNGVESLNVAVTAALILYAGS